MLNICIRLYEASDYYMRAHISDIISNGKFISYQLLYNKQSQNFLTLDSSLLLLSRFSCV